MSGLDDRTRGPDGEGEPDDSLGDETIPLSPPGERTVLSGGTAPDSQVDAAFPERIGDYRVAGELGRGGMGVVYIAEDPRLKRQIAIKVLPATVAGNPEWLSRFEREAQLLAALNHPNIATIHSLEEAGEVRFLTLELIPGENLGDRIGSTPLALDDTLTVCRQIAAALEAAHKKGVVHLDIKPGNVRVTPDGLVKVLDFGLARAISGEATSQHSADTGGGGIVGTPGYMSPEQFLGGPLDHRSDIWALGCILYECLTGQRAFPGETLGEVHSATLTREPDWQILPEELPENLREVFSRCLVKDVGERLPSVVDLRRAIEEGIQARALSTLDLARRESRQAAPNNLPIQLTSFVGRRKEREEIQALLIRTSLLTLSGMGGSGKTRLSLEVASEVIEDYVDGAWLVELAPLTNPDLLPQTVATVLGLKEERNRSMTETIAGFLKQKNILLLLDNCEHLLTACAELASTLLRVCPELRIIATSREGLGIAGESIYHVPSLTIPAAASSYSAEELSDVESIQLLVERARAVKPDFALTDEDAPAAVEICRRLDGIPLAIELAVARVKVMSVGEIASRLDDRFRLLTGGSRTALPHHKTLRALIDWSYEGLTEDEAALFRRLSLFAGGWAMDAAETVCAGEDLDEWEVLDLLSRLVDKSLVEVDAEGGQRIGKTRYRMLETVRSYAQERLREQEEADPARLRHRDFFLALAEEAEPLLGGGGQVAWLARLQAENDNLRSALETCEEEGSDPTLGLRLAGALGRFWEVHGHWSEGRAICTRAAARPDAGDPSARAKVLVCAGSLALHQGDSAEAQTSFEESLEIRRRLGEKRGIAQSLNSVGLVAWIRGDFDRARGFFEESLAIRRELDDRPGIAMTLNNLGNLARDQGDYPSARSLHEESLAIKRELGHEGGIALSLNNLGAVLRRQGDLDQARAFYEESLAIRRQLSDKQGIAQSLNSLGNIAEEQGDYEEALRLYIEGLAIKRELGDRSGITVSLVNLSTVARERGDYEQARALLEESLGIERELGHKRGIALLFHQLGSIVKRMGDLDEARSFLEDSVKLRQEVDDRMGIAECLESLGLLAAAADQPLRAARILGAADAVREALKAPEPPPEQERVEGEAALRATLGDEAFDRERDEGKAMAVEEAIRYALEVPAGE